MRRIFDWYVEAHKHPFIAYPVGWRWFQPKVWKACRMITEVSTLEWCKLQREAFRKATETRADA
jgi:hypothetical protein